MKINRLISFIVIIGFLVYFNSLFNGFVWDDEEQVLNNLPAHSITNIFQFFRESTFNSGGTGTLGGLYYKPLMTTSFSLIYTFFGPNPFFFHLFQLSIHITSAIFVFLIFKHFLKIKLLAFTLALFFLIHPINTEAVVYISDLQDILFMFFGLWALNKSLSSALHLRGVIVISTLLLASLLSKETGALFFIIIGFYILLFNRKIIWKYALSAITALSIYSILRFAVAGIFFNKHGLSPITVMPLSERVLSIPKIIFSYLKTFIYPDNLAINQHWAVKSINWNDFIFPAIVDSLFFLTLFGAAFILWRKKSENLKTYLFFLGWFVIGLGLHLQIFPLDLTYSDRWFYFPIVGLLGMIGVVLSVIPAKAGIQNKNWIPGLARNDKVWMGIAVLIILALSTRTFIRNMDWHNGLTLYGHDIRISKDSFDLENNYGVELFRDGQLDDAAVHFKRSIELAPSWWTNWNNLGVIYERKKDYKTAKEYYKRAMDNGEYYLSFENYANILLFYDKDPKAAKDFITESLKKLPVNSKLWMLLSLADYQLNLKDEALLAARQAYILSPSEQTAYIYSRLSQNQPLEFK